MYEDEFPLRLAQLRQQKGVSARDMSLSIGQNAGYINNIESGKALPSMSNFFYICEYLNITPSSFFDTDTKNPEKLVALIEKLKRLDDAQLNSISILIDVILK
ncbi:helix-turn-helix domain-containing protein [Oscillospiraceae bacterium HCP3S3_F4]